MIVRKMRLQKGWSQEQLATLSGLNVRTIQRIERGQKAGLESLKSLAAVFEVELSDLQVDEQMDKEKEPETGMKSEQTLTMEEQEALEYVRDIKAFYSNLISYLVFVPLIALLNHLVSPTYYWFWWGALGWGIGIVIHAITVFEYFDFFGKDWERKQIEKRLGRKL